MTGVFKYKSPHCIEWCFNTYSRRNSTEKIFLRNEQCNLLYDSNNNYLACLYCETNSTFTPAIDIIIVSTRSPSRNSYGTTASESTFKRIKYQGGGKIEIWRHDSGYQLPNVLTLEIITPEVQISKEILPQATSKSSLHSQNKSLSYLDKSAHFKFLSDDLSKLFNDSSNSDVTITCDSKTFHAHKNILVARSKTFLAMLNSNMIESKTGQVNIKNINSSIFESFLRYLYSGMLPELSMETANELYKVGDQYAVEELKKACAEFMTKNLSENNACDVLVLADLHSDKDFRRNVISYIIERKIPQKDKKWSDFCKNHAILANEVLNLYINKHCPT